MKKLFTLILAFIALTANSQSYNCTNGAVLEGFNNVPIVLEQVVSNDKDIELLASELLKLNRDHKLIRYEGGEGYLTEKFDDQFTLKFIMACKQADVTKVTLRSKIADIEGSLRTYELLETYTIQVQFIELDNEPYAEAKEEHEWKFLWDWLTRSVRPNHYQRQANRYGQQGNKLADAFIDKYGAGIKDKLAFATDIPDDYKGEVWYGTLLNQFADINTAILHVYVPAHMVGREDLWKAQFIKGLEVIKESGKEIIVTEFNAYNYENMSESQAKELASKKETHELYCWIRDTLIEYGAKLIMHHYMVGYHDSPFIKYRIDQGKIFNNYK